LLDVVKALTMFDKAGVKVLGFIQNMAVWVCPDCGRKDHIFGEGGAAREAEKRNISMLGEIPLSMNIREASDEGKPIVVAEPKSPQAAEYRRIARQLVSLANLNAEPPNNLNT
jgi:ATP-binding protein involved in chromosome partitioning